MADSPSPQGHLRWLQAANWWPKAVHPRFAAAGLIGLVAVVMGLGKVLHSEPSPSHASAPTAPQGIAAIGRLEPKGEVIDVSAPAMMEGAKVETLLVSLGDQVRKGQLIAVLDNHDRMTKAFERSKQQLNVAKMRLLQVQAGAKTGEILAQVSRVEQYRREMEGQTASQALAIKRLGYQLKNAQIECHRYNKLFNAGAVSASQRDTICLVADTTLQQKLEAQAQLQRTQKTLAQQIREAISSRAAVAEVRPIDVSVASAEVKEAYARMKEAESNLALSLVRSPHDGQILKVITKEGEKVDSQGVVKLGNTKQMMVVAEVYETDVSRLKIGQKATVNGQGLTDTLTGVVEEIGLSIGKKDLLGTDPAAASDARVLEVKIQLSPQSSRQARRLTNLQVDVVIQPRDPDQSKQ